MELKWRQPPVAEHGTAPAASVPDVGDTLVRVNLRMSFIVFGSAVLTRLAFQALAIPTEVPLDSDEYRRLAGELLAGHGYVSETGMPTSMRPPFYPLFLAALYAVFGPVDGPIRVVQALLDAGTCTLAALLARRHFGERAAWFTAALTVFSWGMLSATKLVLTETLLMLLIVASIWVLDHAIERGRVRWCAVVGVLSGLATLTKGTGLALVSAQLLAIAVTARPTRWVNRLWSCTALVAAFGLVLLPWTWRNYQVHGELIPGATQVGIIVYSSYLPPQGKIFGVHTEDAFTLRAQGLREAEASRALAQEGLRHTLANPGELPRLVLLKLLYAASPFDWELLGGDGWYNFTYAFAVPFAIAGLWLSRGHGRALALLGAPIATSFVLMLLLYGSPRLRLSVEPLLLVFGGYGLAVATGTTAGRPVAARAAVAVFLLVNVAVALYGEQVKDISAGVLAALGVW